MKKARTVILLLLLAAGAAFAVDGLAPDPTLRFEFTDCASGGSTAQTLTEGVYLFRVTTEDVFICHAATCAAGGEKYPAGFAMLHAVGRGGLQLSCRSAASTGDAIYTAVR